MYKRQNDAFLPYLVWYGISPLAKQDPQALVNLAKECTWPKTLKWMARSLATQPEVLNALLAGAKAEQAETILEGMAAVSYTHLDVYKRQG